MTSSKKDRNLAIDFLRILAIVAVVTIHTTTKILDMSHFNILSTPVSFYLNQAARFAVPLFFLISGFVLEYNYKENFKYATFFKRRAARIIVPYLVWSIFYLFVVNNYSLTNFGSPDSVMSLLSDLLVGGASYQLYFIPSLAVFYIFFPVLHRYVRLLSNRYILFILGGVEFVLLAQDYYIGTLGISKPLRIVLLSYFMFFIGMYASVGHDSLYLFARKYTKPLLFGIVLLSALVTVQSGSLYLGSHNTGFIYEQYRPDVYVLTLLIFVVSFTLSRYATLFRPYIITISHLSYFVFFVHVFILEVVWQYGEGAFFSSYIAGRGMFADASFSLFFTCSVCFLSFLLAYIFHKIPKLSSITG